MARFMTTGRYGKYPLPPRRSERTRPDRWGQRILDKARREVASEPRPEIVKELLSYVAFAATHFPGVPSSVRTFKRYTSEEDVLQDVAFADLTRVGYRGYLGMMLIRDEFPTDYFVMECTEAGPRLILNSDVTIYNTMSDLQYLVSEILDVCG